MHVNKQTQTNITMEISAMRIQLSLRGIALQGLCLDFFGVISCSIEAQLFKSASKQNYNYEYKRAANKHSKS